MPSTNPARLSRENAQLLIIDIQERLLPFITDHENVLAHAERMIRAATTLEIPVILSEQYPRGLGPTAASINAAAEGAVRCEKMTFSFCADQGCRERLVSVERPQVLIVGIESHVCVQQTALDLLDMQMQPIVLADAVGSRRPTDYQIAIDGMRAAGVVVTTVESAIFQMVHDSGSALFKSILPLVR